MLLEYSFLKVLFILINTSMDVEWGIFPLFYSVIVSSIQVPTNSP